MILNEHAFDELAKSYDDAFSNTLIGSLMRRRVWRWLERDLTSGQRLLELNCGTGVDALHLAHRGIYVDSSDASAQMVKVATHKVNSEGMAHRVNIQQMSIEELNGYQPEYLYDAVLSNFGGINCVFELAVLAKELRRLCKTEARVFLCVMGPVVPWEWLWFVSKGQFSKAFRRLSSKAVQWRGLTLYYPSINDLQRAFNGYFTLINKAGLGVLMPPPYTESWACRHTTWIYRLNRWEQKYERCFPFPWLADHYLVEFHAN